MPIAFAVLTFPARPSSIRSAIFKDGCRIVGLTSLSLQCPHVGSMNAPSNGIDRYVLPVFLYYALFTVLSILHHSIWLYFEPQLPLDLRSMEPLNARTY